MARYNEATIPEGITPRYRHFRDVNGRLVSTNCTLMDSTGNAVVSGYTNVSIREKSPSKKIGRAVSLGRALKKLSECYRQDVKGGNYVKSTTETN